MPDIPTSKLQLEVVVDADSRTIISASETLPSDPTTSFTFRYLDWRPFPDGTAHPWRIEDDFEAKGAKSHGVHIVQSLEVLPLASQPTPFRLPKDALIVDRIDNVQRDGDMNITGPLSPITPAPSPAAEKAAAQAAWRPWLIGGGVGALALAGLTRWLRSRGV
jgi:hypothetical protein